MGHIIIDRDGIYTDADIRLALGLTSAALCRARRKRELRYTRRGRRVLYRGQWLLEWLERTSDRTDDDGRR